MHPQTPLDQEIVAWYDSQTEELLATLPGYEDGLTPRQAWYAFFNLCSSPATNTTGESLAAPADGGQGAGSVDLPSGAVVLGSFVDGNDGLTHVWGTCEGGFFATETLDGPSWCVWSMWHELASALLQRQGPITLQDFRVFLNNELDSAVKVYRAPSPLSETLAAEVKRCRPFVVRANNCEAALSLISEWLS